MAEKSVQFNEDKRHAVYARDGYNCAYCGHHDETRSGAGMSIDHVVARENGGEGQAGKHEPATNLITACGPCNSTKQDMTNRAFNAYLKADGRPPFDPAKIRAQTAKKIDIKVGEKNAASAAAFRSEAMRRVGVTNVKQLSSIASRGLLQERLAEHAAGTERPHGPGICHDERGQFVACRRAVIRAARAAVAVLRARLAER